MLVEKTGRANTGQAEPLEVKLAVSPLHLVLAIAACLIIFAAGLFVGRTTADTEADTNLAVEDGVGNQDATVDQRGTIASSSGTDANTNTNTNTDAESDPIEASEPLTVEALEARLAALEIDSIGFVTGTDELLPSSRSIVDDAAAVLVDMPAIPVEIEVKTFTEATPGLNHGLSVLQAEALMRLFVAAGVDGDRLAAVGLGSLTDGSKFAWPVLLFDSDDSGLSAALRELQAVITLDSDSTIGAEGQTVLDDVASAMTEHPAASITLAGYATAETPEASHDQSHVIADAAYAGLASRGIDVARLSTIGFGESPIVFEVETEIEFEVGFPAAMTLAFRQLDLERISFESGTDQLKAEGLAILGEVAMAMGFDETVAVEIAAHSYSERTSAENHDLSHRQGRAVVEALVAAGVARDRLVVVGHGDPIQFAEPGRESYVTFYPLG